MDISFINEPGDEAPKTLVYIDNKPVDLIISGFAGKSLRVVTRQYFNEKRQMVGMRRVSEHASEAAARRAVIRLLRDNDIEEI